MSREACIVGVGETEYSRRSGQSDVRLAARAVVAAFADAGLPTSTIDAVLPAYRDAVSAEEMISTLGLRDVRFTATVQIGGATPVASLGVAKTAIESGAAETAVVFVGRNGCSGTRIAQRIAAYPNQRLRAQLEHPYGWTTPAQHYAMLCRRHMHLYGTTKEHLGIVAVTMREHAQLNPRAMMHGLPITLEDYHRSEWIADPYQKLDACLETDGGAAIVITTRERALSLEGPPITIAAAAEGRPDTPDDITNRPDLLTIGLSKAAPRAFAYAGIHPDDVSAAMIYDCFTFEAIHQLEEAGFCERGAGGEFVKRKGIGLAGALPVNTHGGLLSEGHMLGANHIIEAVRQLRGECGARQIAGAKWIAVTGWGNLGDGAIALLRNDDA